MTPRDVRLYVYDIARACELVRTFTAGNTFDDYNADAMLRSAVERQFEIIGEALSQASALDPSLREQITHAGDIIGFRNRLIHGYPFVSNVMVWSIVEDHLPLLSEEAGALLERLGPP
jgi:uncharacterized protein with HEPN domain